MITHIEREQRFNAITWEGSPHPTDVIAVIVRGHDGPATVWYNTRLARGLRLLYIDFWARYALSHGRHFDAIRLVDLERMEGDGATTP